MEKIQIHYEPDGMYIGEHPDAMVQADAHEEIVNAENKGRTFREFLDSTPNSNENYQPVLDQIAETFAEDGMEISPVSILTHENYVEAVGILVGREDDELWRNHGLYVAGRAIINEEHVHRAKEFFGQSYTLAIAIHEAAHSTARTRYDVLTSKIVEHGAENLEDNDMTRNRTFSIQLHGGGFHKHVHKNENLGLTGSYWEEAFAELTRVRYSRRLGVESHLSRGNIRNIDGMKLTYVSDSADLTEVPEGNVIMPDRFADAIGEGEEPPVAWSPPNFAAYGLELLDQKVPGLFEEMQASRKDPSRQREVIKMINGVRPGLYRELRDLPYSPEGFRSGLKLIQDALIDDVPVETTTEKVTAT